MASLRAQVVTIGLALALALAGCGARTDFLDPGRWQSTDADLPGDDAPPADGALDADPDADPEPADVGHCTFAGKELLCEPGQSCHANYLVGPSPFICSFSGDPAVPCGLISCGEGCACQYGAKSTCSCVE